MLSTDSLQAKVTPDFNLQQLRKLAMKEVMRTLRLSGAQKIAAGLTTMEEVLRVAPPAEK